MSRLHVAVAVLQDCKGRVLLAQRAAHAHQGGLWEFPGGKVETGESVAQALERELAEELGIAVTESRPLLLLDHDYPDRLVTLDVHLVTDFRGEPVGREGQALRWVSVAAIDKLPLPAANLAIVAALRDP